MGCGCVRMTGQRWCNCSGFGGLVVYIVQQEFSANEENV